MNSTQRWLYRKYLTYQLFTNLWFVGAVWLYFYRLFITDQQTGLLDGMAFAIGLLAEVPSGALADKFGRDKIVRIGQILAGSGVLLQAVSSSFAPIFVGQAIMMIGVALVSGADEALFFENMRFDRKSRDWRKLVTRGSQVALLGTLFATLVGGWLHTINPRLPWVLNGLAFIISALIIWQVKDTRSRAARQNFKVEVASYLSDIKSGFMHFGTVKLRTYILYIIAVQGLFYTVGYGLLRLVLLSRFHISPVWGAVVLASCSLLSVGLLAYMHKHAEQLSERRVLTIIGVSAAIGLLMSLANLGAWGYLVILILYLGEHILQPFMSEILNNHTSDQQRATVLSVASFLKTLPYVLLGPLIGYLNTNHDLHYFLLGWAGFIVAAVVIYIVFHKRDIKVQLPA